jgi:hypothetical protein
MARFVTFFIDKIFAYIKKDSKKEAKQSSSTPVTRRAKPEAIQGKASLRTAKQ